ncbi:MAG: precorrin-6A reductase [Eubacteriales bacterium]|jgi:precorrin-6A/cobalt-precorrin-6A reductase
MKRILLFGGTTEGRLLAEYLSHFQAEVTVSVATDYGRELLPSSVKGVTGRLTAQEMVRWMQEAGFDAVVDATHPYAREVSRNIQSACDVTGTPCLRLLRESSDTSDCVRVENAQQAAEYLTQTEGPVLLTTGSKELAAFTRVPGYAQRLYPRVLPTPEVLAHCHSLGFTARTIIAMQGPFSREMDVAMLRQTGARYLVTKDGGSTGGAPEKLAAARELGVQVILIGRPTEDGMSWAEMLDYWAERLPLRPGESLPSRPAATGEAPLARENTPYFPLFFPLRGQRVVVVGGGAIALRRIRTLLPFGCDICWITPQRREPVEGVQWLARPYQPGDCRGAKLVLAVTDDPEVNEQVCRECRQLGIWVNRADKKEACDFYFPAVIRRGDVVIGVTASGADHRLNRRVADAIRQRVGELIPGEEP